MRFRRAIAVLGLLCTHCSSTTPAPVSAGPARDAGTMTSASHKDAGHSPPDAGSDAAPRDAATVGGFALSGNMSDAVTGDPLASVTICLLDSPATCTKSDANGDFSIRGLGAKGSGITGALAGYVTGVWPVTPTGNVSGWSILLRTENRVAKLAQNLGTTFGPSAGAIVFAVKDGSGNPLSGVTITSTRGTVGYYDANGAALDLALTDTTSHGGGFIFDVSPGDVGLTFEISGRTCVRNGAEGWPGSNGETMTVPVQGGKLTRAAAVCQ
jgi:hypothetical protein